MHVDDWKSSGLEDGVGDGQGRMRLKLDGCGTHTVVRRLVEDADGELLQKLAPIRSCSATLSTGLQHSAQAGSRNEAGD